MKPFSHTLAHNRMHSTANAVRNTVPAVGEGAGNGALSLTVNLPDSYMPANQRFCRLWTWKLAGSVSGLTTSVICKKCRKVQGCSVFVKTA